MCFSEPFVSSRVRRQGAEVSLVLEVGLRTAELRSSTRTAGSKPTESERTIANWYGYAGFLRP
jgi:hypothetical protein